MSASRAARGVCSSCEITAYFPGMAAREVRADADLRICPRCGKPLALTDLGAMPELTAANRERYGIEPERDTKARGILAAAFPEGIADAAKS